MAPGLWITDRDGHSLATELTIKRVNSRSRARTCDLHLFQPRLGLFSQRRIEGVRESLNQRLKIHHDRSLALVTTHGCAVIRHVLCQFHTLRMRSGFGGKIQNDWGNAVDDDWIDKLNTLLLQSTPVCWWIEKTVVWKEPEKKDFVNFFPLLIQSSKAHLNGSSVTEKGAFVKLILLFLVLVS